MLDFRIHVGSSWRGGRERRPPLGGIAGPSGGGRQGGKLPPLVKRSSRLSLPLAMGEYVAGSFLASLTTLRPKRKLLRGRPRQTKWTGDFRESVWLRGPGALGCEHECNSLPHRLDFDAVHLSCSFPAG